MYRIACQIISIIIIITLLPSCRKTKDNSPPVIRIEAPPENQAYNVYDYINVKAEICDDQKLEYIKVYVSSESYSAVSQAQNIYPETLCYNLNAELYTDDIHLKTGKYYIIISASDGSNVTNIFQSIYIYEVPRRLKSVLVLTANGQQYTLHRIDSMLNSQIVKTINGDYSGSSASSNNQLFYFAGRYSTDVYAFSTINWELQWSIPIIPSTVFPYFEAIEVWNDKLYVSYREGKFEVYNVYGNIILQKSTTQSYYPIRFLPTETFLYTYQEQPSGNNKKISVYFSVSTSLVQDLITDFNIVKMFPYNQDQSFLFCNSNNQGSIKLYSVSGNNYWNFPSAPQGKISDACRIDGENYLIAAQNEVLWLNYNLSSLTTLISGVNSSAIFFDDENNAIYIADNEHYLKRFTFPGGVLSNTVYFSDSIVNIIPLYNKDK